MKWLIGILIIAAVAFGFYYYFMPDLFPGGASTATTTVATSTVQQRAFTSSTYGLSFAYPDSYALEERDITEGIPSHTITLADREAVQNAPANGEGPASINIAIFDATTISPSVWARESVASNFQLALGSMSSTTVGGVEAVSYRTDGLYATDNIVVVHEGRAYMFSVGWVSADDVIVSDFQALISSVRFN